jgi:signal transduction histidine kinase
VAWLEGLIENTCWAAAEIDASALRRRVMPAAEATEAAVALVKPLLSRKGQRVEVTYCTPMPAVFGDPQRLAQVVVNLLTNASLSSHHRDVINLDVSRTDEMVEIRVTDHGPGIPYQEQARIFDRYVRGAAAGETRGRGLGLGLHLAKSLVESHAGTIGVESVPGQGASFWCRLPQCETSYPQ